MKSNKPKDSYYHQETERLAFRPLTLEDIEPWSHFFNDNPTERFLGGDLLGDSPIAKSSMWIKKQIWRQDEKAFGQMAVTEKESGKFIGLGGLIARDDNEFEVTYSFFPDAWGKGFGTELAVHFKKYAFDHIDISYVVSMIHIENEASMHVARKNGMEIIRETEFLGMPIYVFGVER